MSAARRITLIAAAATAAAMLFVLRSMPDAPLSLADSAPQSTSAPAGALHVHSSRSDGSGSADEIAQAAARAGLQFVVLTDHGDGTRAPDEPRYVSGVLMLDGVELSTDAGHYIAIGLPRAPYPLRGEARDVVEDVRRLGGFGSVAHPDSAKPALRWTDWDAPFDAIEWLNLDSAWRDESRLRLARALILYPFRPSGTLGSLLDRPDTTLARWDALNGERPVVAVAGADAHARIGWVENEVDGYREGWFLRFPSYESTFRTFSVRVELDAPLSRDAAAAASQIISGLKRGRVYTQIDALAAPASLQFAASREGTSARVGDVVPDAVAFRAITNASGEGRVVIRRDGQVVAQHPLPSAEFVWKGEEGAYRAEVYLDRARVPWILSNPIYVHKDSQWGRAQPPTSPTPAAYTQLIQGGPWHVEKDDGSRAEFAQADAPEGPVQFTYQLGGGPRRDQHAALVIGVGTGLRERSRISFSARASGPLRVSVQLRDPKSGSRWKRSVYLDKSDRDVVVPFDDMRPVNAAEPRTLDPGQADTILFVIDTVNAEPGSEGSLTLADLRIEG